MRIPGPAKIIEPPINVRVIAGETALFFCRATGNPTPTVNFLIDRTISHPRLGAGVVLTIPDGSLLRLNKVHRDQNGLQVECVTRNHVGGDSATAHLTVYETNSEVPEGYPVIHVAPKATTVAVGDIARLDCDVAGTPNPRVIWIKNEIPIPTSGSRITIVGTGSLLFDHVLLSDEGHYECLVTNEIGSVLSSKAYLSVKNTYFVPKIVDKLDQIRVRPGHGANLTCRASGNPIPSTRWLTDRERPITESKEGVATLFLADVTEPARYICEANNSLGTVQHPVRVNVLDVPPPPQNLRCLEEGPTYAFLQWYPPNISREFQLKAPDGHVIDSYTLFLAKLDNLPDSAPSTSSSSPFRKQLTDIPARQFHPDGALQYKVTDLQPYTNYSVEVAAVSNLLGMSDPSNRIVFTTAEVGKFSRVLVVGSDVPPPPQNLRCLEEGPTYAFLQWYPPNISREFQLKAPDGHVIDSYTLFLAKLDNLPDSAPSTSSSSPFRKQLTDIPARQFHPDGALQYKVTDLQPYTNYSVEVAAVSNLLGMSDPSNRIVFTTAEVGKFSRVLVVGSG
ncbi:putative cell adhesion molecule [Fasciolopsis buskii]|uniref:Putative cell adhesion molecule n=1 Tax=Fasciolopsis buskii TaxID=27845 RepID=A0A8E0VHP6_9TREM|nr:putative cell adhesion molecule [Fasciolopsis buski]